MSERKRMPSQTPAVPSEARTGGNPAPEADQPDSLSPRSAEEESALGSGGPTRDEIAARAYQRWQERGGGDGASTEDWHQAEQELRAEKGLPGSRTRSAVASGH